MISSGVTQALKVTFNSRLNLVTASAMWLRNSSSSWLRCISAIAKQAWKTSIMSMSQWNRRLVSQSEGQHYSATTQNNTNNFCSRGKGLIGDTSGFTYGAGWGLQTWWRLLKGLHSVKEGTELRHKEYWVTVLCVNSQVYHNLDRARRGNMEV